MSTSLIDTTKNTISTVTTAVLVKSYVGVSVVLAAAKSRKQDKKRNNDFKIRRRLAENKLKASANAN